MTWPLISIDDLTPDDVESILEQAEHYATASTIEPRLEGSIVGLIFFETSLRTRAGFHAAATRLGARAIEVTGARASPLSMGESWEDTVRVVSGYVDVVVGRIDADVRGVDTSGRPFISGGDRGARPEHPTQALADVFAIRTMMGSAAEHVVLVGDPGMRAARSLRKLLGRSSECRLTVVTHPSMADAAPDVVEGLEVTNQIPNDADVVYVTGMHHESLPLDDRDRLIVTAAKTAQLREDAIILSPMPVIDEIEPAARRNHRVRMFEQSDLALFVRMAVLAYALRDARTN